MPGSDKEAKAFISYSHKDSKAAHRLKRQLEARRVESWIFERHLPFSAEIADAIESQISQADHVLVLLTDNAPGSDWIPRELGLALKLQEDRNEKYPSIIGVYPDLKPPQKLDIRPADFYTEEVMEEKKTFRFGSTRNHVVNNELSCDVLADQLKPKVRFIRGTDGDEGELLQESFKCYEKLFPVEQRNEAGDIIQWLDAEYLSGTCENPWREVYAVLQIGTIVAGVAFFSVHTTRHWVFGGWFGIRSQWRHKHRALDFWSKIHSEIVTLDEDSRGVVFEVDPLNLRALQEASGQQCGTKLAGNEELCENFRRLRRLYLFGQHAIMLYDSSGNAFPVWQPALDGSMDTIKEREHHLMVVPIQSKARLNGTIGELDPTDVISFLYDMYAESAYVGCEDDSNFQEYLRDGRERVEARLASAGGCFKKPTHLRPLYRKLLSRINRGDCTV